MGYTNDPKTGWKDVYDRLKQAIETGEYAPGDKLPTEAKLIVELGASKMTIHRALRELASDGHIEGIERVGNFVAGTPQTKPSRGKIGLFLPTHDGFLEIKLLSGIQEVLGDRQIVLYSTDSEAVLETELLDQAANEVDGILILPTGHPIVAQKLLRIHQSGCPVVCIDREPTSVRLPSVTTDNYGIAKTALDYLVQSGHRRIAYFGLHTPEMSSNADRCRAFQDTVRKLGEKDPSNLMRFIEARGSDDFPVELRLFEDSLYRLTSGPDPITAAFCANEHYLSVLLEVAQSLPEQVIQGFEIVSFCDWPILSFPKIPIHLIRQDARAVGRTAAALLQRALSGETIPAQRVEVAASFEPASGSLLSAFGKEAR